MLFFPSGIGVLTSGCLQGDAASTAVKALCVLCAGAVLGCRSGKSIKNVWVLLTNTFCSSGVSGVVLFL